MATGLGHGESRRVREGAEALGVPQLNCLAGKTSADVADDVLRRTFVDNLRCAAAELDRPS